MKPFDPRAASGAPALDRDGAPPPEASTDGARRVPGAAWTEREVAAFLARSRELVASLRTPAPAFERTVRLPNGETMDLAEWEIDRSAAPSPPEPRPCPRGCRCHPRAVP